LTVDVVNAGQIDLSWEKPASDGGSEITGYRVHITNDTTNADLQNTDTVSDPVVINFEVALSNPAVFDAKKELTFSVKGLRAQQTWTVAVTAHNGATPGDSPLSDTAIVTMPMFDVPAMPVGLVAESAVDTNLRGVTKQGVLLMWNAPEAPAGAEITAYEVQRSVNGEDPEALVTFSQETPDANASPPLRALATYGTDADSPAADEVRVYQVRTVAKATTEATEEIKSEWAEVRFPADTSHTEPLPLVAPDSVTAMIDETDPRLDDVIVTWTGGSGPEGTKVAIGIFTRDFSTFLTDRTVNDAMGGTHKFDDLPDGEYVIVVATYHPDDLTVGAGKRSNVIAVPGS
jgi:hypothetical protein